MRRVLVILSFLFFILPSCSGEKGQERALNLSPKPEEALKVDVATVISKTVVRRVETTGTILPWDEVTVANEIAGTIGRIFVDMGDSVKDGDLLLMLDSREALLELDRSEASLQASIKALEKTKAVLEDAKINLERYRELFREGVVSRVQLDNIETRYSVAVAEVKEAEARVALASAERDITKKRLGDYEIRSPISGEVKKRLVARGETIREKSPMFILVKIDVLKFQGTVPEQYAPAIRVGKTIQVFVDAVPTRPFSGRIERVNPALDSETRTLGFEARLPNPGGLLKPGLFARGFVSVGEEREVPFVPERAVYSSAGITKVFVISDEKAEERQVKPGIREDGMVEIKDGVKPGEMVATANLVNLFDGAKVEVRK